MKKLNSFLFVSTVLICAGCAGRNAFYHYTRGIEYLKQDKADLAVIECNKAIEFDPSQSNFYLARGLGYGRQNKFNLAHLNFDKALSIDKNDKNFFEAAESYFTISSFYAQNGQYDKGIANLNESLEMIQKEQFFIESRFGPERYRSINAAIHYLLAAYYSFKEDQEHAFEHLTAATSCGTVKTVIMNLKPTYYDFNQLYEIIGDIYAYHDQHKEAIQFYDKAVAYHRQRGEADKTETIRLRIEALKKSVPTER